MDDKEIRKYYKTDKSEKNGGHINYYVLKQTKSKSGKKYMKLKKNSILIQKEEWKDESLSFLQML